jgi:septum formation protein
VTAPRVILASASPRRHDLLNMIGIAHEVLPADIDETYPDGEDPPKHAERLAKEKCAALTAQYQDAIVIAADTIVVLDGHVLGKPADDSEAARTLRRLAARPHTVFTAMAVGRGARILTGVEEVSVTFRALDDATIERYIATREPMDKAGAYGIQGYGAAIVERIDGDYFAVMGLAIGRMLGLLRRLGVRYDFKGLEVE